MPKKGFFLSIIFTFLALMFSISNASKVVEHAEENDELSVAFKHKIALMDSVFENSLHWENSKNWWPKIYSIRNH